MIAKIFLFLILIEIPLSSVCLYGSKPTDSIKVKDSFLNNSDSLNSINDSISPSADTIEYKDTLSFSEKQDLIRSEADSLAKTYSEQFKEKQLNSQQLLLLSEMKKETMKVDEYIKHGIDTSEFNAKLDRIENEFKLASQGTLENEGAFRTVRNLTTSALLMKELLIQLESKKKSVESYLANLNQYRKTIDSLQTDPILFKFAKDSVIFIEYFEKLLTVSLEITPADSSLTNSIKTLNEFESRIDNLNIRIKDTEQKIIANRNSLSEDFAYRDTPNIWNLGESPDSLNSILRLSYLKDKLILKYFLINNIWSIILMLAAFGILVYLNFKLREHFRSKNTDQELSRESKLIIDFPVMTTSFIVIMIFEFLFTNPPVIFQGLLWISASLMLTKILSGYLSKQQMKFWLFLIFCFFMTLIANIILGISFAERILLILIASAGIIMGLIALRINVFDDRFSKFKKLFLAFTILILIVSVFVNIFGRYNFSKLLITVSFFMLISAYLLYWTMILGIEFLKLISHAFKTDKNENYLLKVQRFSARTPIALKIFLFAGWLILLIRNFHLYDYLTNKLFYFLEEERTIGDFTFNYENILIFFFIILLSSIISKLIAFIADQTDSANIQKSGQKSGLSNWMLLIRIGVMSIGVLLAFAATGIPIDRITIIIGSLGIGIGLGLQGIINNLVSGIILAFEKPFRLGDKIEVGDKSGKIKEIGIRSSKLSTSDGAVVIIPNGDLLSKQVTNWTLTDTRKRSEVLLSFNNSDHRNKIRDILQNILDANADITKHPPPVVFIHNFGSSVTEYKLLYWTEIENAEQVKSELMLKIDNEMENANIKFDS